MDALRQENVRLKRIIKTEGVTNNRNEKEIPHNVGLN